VYLGSDTLLCLPWQRAFVGLNNDGVLRTLNHSLAHGDSLATWSGLGLGFGLGLGLWVARG
jgi:hypothetical protein